MYEQINKAEFVENTTKPKLSKYYFISTKDYLFKFKTICITKAKKKQKSMQ